MNTKYWKCVNCNSDMTSAAVRVYVGLPDARNRAKILKVLLLKENLEPDFSVKQLAEATEGYSGDDLKVKCIDPRISHCGDCSCLNFSDILCFSLQNLCIAAAYRPVKELLERESKVATTKIVL